MLLADRWNCVPGKLGSHQVTFEAEVGAVEDGGEEPEEAVEGVCRATSEEAGQNRDRLPQTIHQLRR